MRKSNLLQLLAPAFAGLWLAGTSGLVRAEGLLEVEQTIFGMDCAPCAYGTVQGLKKLPGAQKVTVSLNQGKAVVVLAENSPVSLTDIREVIRKNGFTPKEASARVSGRLVRVGDELRLQAGKENYRLMSTAEAGEAWQKLRRLPEGAVVVLQVWVPEQPLAPSPFVVTGLVRAG